DVAPVVALLLEGGLHVSYDLGRIIIRTRGVDRSVPGIHRVGCITPCRVPVRGIPIVPTTVDKDDVVVMRLPPPLVIPKRMIVRKDCVLRTFPLISAGDLVVLVEVNRLVLVDDDLFIVGLQVEVLLLVLHATASRDVALTEFLLLIE